jgi:hypothetical protein
LHFSFFPEEGQISFLKKDISPFCDAPNAHKYICMLFVLLICLLSVYFSRLEDLNLQKEMETRTTGVGEDAGKKEPSYTVGGNVN